MVLIQIGQVDAIGTHISILLTIISAYLIASYLVGRKLTRLQVSVATSIYIVAYIFEAIILTVLFISTAVASQKYRERYSIESTFVFESVASIGYVGAIIMSAILVSSLWFMWSVRHSEK